MEFPLFYIICTLGAIVRCTPPEGVITKLSAVNARTKTTKTIYSRARIMQEQVETESNIISPTEKKNEPTVDLETRSRICSSTLNRASEFGSDIYKSRGEVFDELRYTEQNTGGWWTNFGVEILASHVRGIDTLPEMTDAMLKSILADIVRSKEGEESEVGNTSSSDKSTDNSEEQTYSSMKLTFPILVNDPAADRSPILEEVFICPRWIRGKEVERYFVSREYNVNFAADSLINPIIARFLFVWGDHGHFNVRAIAEEPAKPVLTLDSTVDIEDLYIERRTGKYPAESASEDRICRLDEKQRFRLCGLIFNSEYFEDKLRFPASYSVVQGYKCQKNTVTLQRRVEESGKLYEEWMTLCFLSYVPYRFYSDPKLTYFVSQAYNPDTNDAISSNDIFLYGIEDDKIFLINSFTNIRLDEILEHI